MKRRVAIFLALLVSGGGALWYWQWRRDAPRRKCLQSLERLDSALQGGAFASLPDLVQVPAALQSRTPAEQTEFIRKALQDEISDEGLTVLRKEGRFGPLTNLFPAEAAAWIAQAGVNPEDGVAFRLDRSNAPRAEVVLARNSKPGTRNSEQSPAFRIVRCNNVQPLAAQECSTPNAHQ